MSAPAGYTSLTAARIMDLKGDLLISGTLEVLFTDSSDRPLAASGSSGFGVPPVTAAVFPVLSGALPSTAWVPDTSLATPPGFSYRFAVKAPDGSVLYTLRNLQPTGPTFNLDTYKVNVVSSLILQDTTDGHSYMLQMTNGVPVWSQHN